MEVRLERRAEAGVSSVARVTTRYDQGTAGTGRQATGRGNWDDIKGKEDSFFAKTTFAAT